MIIISFFSRIHHYFTWYIVAICQRAIVHYYRTSIVILQPRGQSAAFTTKVTYELFYKNQAVINSILQDQMIIFTKCDLHIRNDMSCFSNDSFFTKSDKACHATHTCSRTVGPSISRKHLFYSIRDPLEKFPFMTNLAGIIFPCTLYY